MRLHRRAAEPLAGGHGVARVPLPLRGHVQRAGGDCNRPAGWYWYGWDYGHFTDALDFPAEVKAHFEEAGLPVPFSTGKRWTVEEIEHDIVDVAISLQESLEEAERRAGQVLPNPLDSRD